MNDRKVVLYISQSLDGFIATNKDDLSWLSIVEKEGLDYGYGAIMDRSDTYIVGSKTYDVVLRLTGGEFPQAKILDCYVISRNKNRSGEGVTFYSGDIKDLIAELKSKPGKDIYCDGGGQIVKLLLDHKLIDEFIISVIPIILGEGKRLFIGDSVPQNIKLIKAESFETGLVQLHYSKSI